MLKGIGNFSAGLLVLVCAVQPAWADGYAWGGTVGVDGVGVEVTMMLTESLAVSAAYGGVGIKTTRDISDVSYKLDGKMRSFAFKAHYFPFDGSRFRTSFGWQNNSTEFNAVGEPQAGTFSFNGNTYDASAVKSVNAWMSFPAATPYIGIGWGNPVRPESRWNFTVDLGFQHLSTLNASLTVACNNNQIDQERCNRLKNDVAQEEQQLQDEINKLKWWPVVKAGLHYQF